MNIVVVGGSGFIGTVLSKKLLTMGNTVIIVDLKAPSFTHEKMFYISCDISNSILPFNVLERTDAVVNLSGVTIGQKWTPEVKEAIRKSRIKSTYNIIESIKQTKSKPVVFVNASAIGFYGDTRDNVVNEQGAKGEGFLAEVVADWETEAFKGENLGLRVVCLRTAPVLGKTGFLAQLTKTSPFGFISHISKKDFYMSWIHIDDITNAYIFALETNTVQGILNASAPENVLQTKFIQTLGTVMNKRVIGTVPEFIMFNQLSAEGFSEFTKSQRVEPKRLIDKGFVFMYPNLRDAFYSIYKIANKDEKNR